MEGCHDHQVTYDEREGCPVCNAESKIRCLEREIREATYILTTRREVYGVGGDIPSIAAANKLVKEQVQMRKILKDFVDYMDKEIVVGARMTRAIPTITEDSVYGRAKAILKELGDN